ncbi:MAG: hypothetical protein KDH88_11580 [Chromatiales bacterium]|nr:hypothetical protein [Chromatiales bacterium]
MRAWKSPPNTPSGGAGAAAIEWVSLGSTAFRLPAILFCLNLVACSAVPALRGEVLPLEFVPIDSAYRSSVAGLLNSGHNRWYSGWMGNIVVNELGGDRRGLCFHWQQAVFDGVADTVRQQGWKALGIGVGRGGLREHHAVVVYDPRRIARDELLHADRQAAAFVLDPWRRGRADVYRLSVWLSQVAAGRAVEFEVLRISAPPVSTPEIGRRGEK